MPIGVYKHQPHSEETKRKISLANALVKRKTGELASNWKGGKPKCLDCEKQLSLRGYKRCGQCILKFHSGENHYNYGKVGKRLSEETRRKISESCRGDKHPNWKGGITSINQKIRHSLEFKLWRTAVFERDNYTCIWCGDKNGNGKAVILNADHIKPFYAYPELRFAIDNGRTLCISCHKTTDTYGCKQII